MADEIPNFEVYSEGFVYASVCTNLPDDETTIRFNAERPSGTETGWQISENPTFRDGKPNPSPCDKHPGTHRHILYSC